MNKNQIESLYRSLGFDHPSCIDIELFAYSQGAVVRKSPLKGCEARIVGANNRAVITVNSVSSPERQCFSIAHELGHWIKDRGVLGSLCKKESMSANRTSNSKIVLGRERVANSYAAEFLMPSFMVRPYAKEEISLDLLRNLKESFQVSWTAASIRLIDLSDYPAIIVCYRGRRRAWFHRSSLVPDFVYPRSFSIADSPSLKAVLAGAMQSSHVVDGDAWLDLKGAEDIVIEELVWSTKPDEIMVLLWWDFEIEV